MRLQNLSAAELIRTAESVGDDIARELAERLYACTLEHETEKADLLEEIKRLEGVLECYY
jgi:hypothetical protein